MAQFRVRVLGSSLKTLLTTENLDVRLYPLTIEKFLKFPNEYFEVLECNTDNLVSFFDNAAENLERKAQGQAETARLSALDAWSLYETSQLENDVQEWKDGHTTLLAQDHVKHAFQLNEFYVTRMLKLSAEMSAFIREHIKQAGLDLIRERHALLQKIVDHWLASIYTAHGLNAESANKILETGELTFFDDKMGDVYVTSAGKTTVYNLKWKTVAALDERGYWRRPRLWDRRWWVLGLKNEHIDAKKAGPKLDAHTLGGYLMLESGVQNATLQKTLGIVWAVGTLTATAVVVSAASPGLVGGGFALAVLIKYVDFSWKVKEAFKISSNPKKEGLRALVLATSCLLDFWPQQIAEQTLKYGNMALDATAGWRLLAEKFVKEHAMQLQVAASFLVPYVPKSVYPYVESLLYLFFAATDTATVPVKAAFVKLAVLIAATSRIDSHQPILAHAAPITAFGANVRTPVIPARERITNLTLDELQTNPENYLVVPPLLDWSDLDNALKATTPEGISAMLSQSNRTLLVDAQRTADEERQSFLAQKRIEFLRQNAELQTNSPLEYENALWEFLKTQTKEYAAKKDPGVVSAFQPLIKAKINSKKTQFVSIVLSWLRNIKQTNNDPDGEKLRKHLENRDLTWLDNAMGETTYTGSTYTIQWKDEEALYLDMYFRQPRLSSRISLYLLSFKNVGLGNTERLQWDTATLGGAVLNWAGVNPLSPNARLASILWLGGSVAASFVHLTGQTTSQSPYVRTILPRLGAFPWTAAQYVRYCINARQAARVWNAVTQNRSEDALSAITSAAWLWTDLIYRPRIGNLRQNPGEELRYFTIDSQQMDTLAHPETVRQLFFVISGPFLTSLWDVLRGRSTEGFSFAQSALIAFLTFDLRRHWGGSVIPTGQLRILFETSGGPRLHSSFGGLTYIELLFSVIVEFLFQLAHTGGNAA